MVNFEEFHKTISLVISVPTWCINDIMIVHTYSCSTYTICNGNLSWETKVNKQKQEGGEQFASDHAIKIT